MSLFSFQSLRLFRLAGELEGKAAALRKEAFQHLTIALAGSDTKELFTLLVTFFGKGTDIDPFSFIDAAPIIKRPLDLTDTESETEGVVMKTLLPPAPLLLLMSLLLLPVSPR